MSRRRAFVVAFLLSSVPANATRTDAALAYAPIRQQLQSSAVPVLLPTALPSVFGPVRSIAVIRAGRDGYYVGFSPAASCSGALSCAFFHVAGAALTPRTDRSYRHDRVVRLPDGRSGYFHPEDCSGASCTEAQLLFERAGAIYELDAKAAGDDLAALERAYGALRAIR